MLFWQDVFGGEKYDARSTDDAEKAKDGKKKDIVISSVKRISIQR
jgi:hypothetical protein